MNSVLSIWRRAGRSWRQGSKLKHEIETGCVNHQADMTCTREHRISTLHREYGRTGLTDGEAIGAPLSWVSPSTWNSGVTFNSPAVRLALPAGPGQMS